MPVIVISGSLNEEEAVKCLHLGATDYLLKQRLERLPNAVRRAIIAADELRKTASKPKPSCARARSDSACLRITAVMDSGSSD